LATVYSGRDLVVKFAPGMDFELAPWAAEVELISLDGDVGEACLWSAGLATSGVRWRAAAPHIARLNVTTTRQVTGACSKPKPACDRDDHGSLAS
jgi:hypothetical protein